MPAALHTATAGPVAKVGKCHNWQVGLRKQKIRTGASELRWGYPFLPLLQVTGGTLAVMPAECIEGRRHASVSGSVSPFPIFIHRKHLSRIGLPMQPALPVEPFFVLTADLPLLLCERSKFRK